MGRLVIKMMFCSQRYLKEQLPQTEANGHRATGVGEPILVTHMDVCHLHLQVLDHLGSELLSETVLLFCLGLTCHRHHCYHHHCHKRYHCYHHHRYKRFALDHLTFLQKCLAFSALANTHHHHHDHHHRHHHRHHHQWSCSGSPSYHAKLRSLLTFKLPPTRH